jgi:hypothetical protein
MMEKEKTRTMRYAERYWTRNGYQFKLVKQYISKAVYLVGKDGVVMKYSHPAVVDDNRGIMGCFEYTFGLFKDGVARGAWESEGVLE